MIRMERKPSGEPWKDGREKRVGSRFTVAFQAFCVVGRGAARSPSAVFSCRSWQPKHCRGNDCRGQCTWISQKVRPGLSALPYRQENELAPFLTNSSPAREPGWKLVSVHFFCPARSHADALPDAACAGTRL